MATKKAPVLHQRANPFSASLAAWSLVSYLLLHGRPTAILRRVISIVINTVQRMLVRRLAAHIRKEVLELLPLFANHNPARSIVLPVSAAWISAAFKHCVPRIVLRPSALTATTASMKAIHAVNHTIEVRCA